MHSCDLSSGECDKICLVNCGEQCCEHCCRSFDVHCLSIFYGDIHRDVFSNRHTDVHCDRHRDIDGCWDIDSMPRPPRPVGIVRVPIHQLLTRAAVRAGFANRGGHKLLRFPAELGRVIVRHHRQP